MKKYSGRKYRASYTVEAALLTPMLLFLVAGSIQLGYQLYTQAEESTVIREEITEFHPVETVRRQALFDRG